MSKDHYIKYLLKALIIVLIVNTSSVYAACCMDIDNEKAAISLPCHESHSDDDPEPTDKKCCSACSLMSLPSQSALTKSVSLHTDIPTVLPLFLFKNIEPPFKPPINHL